MLNFIGYYHCQYDSKTLSSKYIDKMRFCERNKWREIAYNQFSDYPDIQEKYTSQTLFYAENEFVEISHKKILFSQKCKLINEIIKNHFFSNDIKKVTKYPAQGCAIFLLHLAGKYDRVEIWEKIDNGWFYKICRE